MNELRLREDEIGRKLAEAHETGELMSAESYGKPLAEDAGWQQTPDEFRMGFRILKNAGVAPAEIELFHERARLRAAIDESPNEYERRSLQKKLSELEQVISVRLESLRIRGSI